MRVCHYDFMTKKLCELKCHQITSFSVTACGGQTVSRSQKNIGVRVVPTFYNNYELDHILPCPGTNSIQFYLFGTQIFISKDCSKRPLANTLPRNYK